MTEKQNRLKGFIQSIKKTKDRFPKTCLSLLVFSAFVLGALPNLYFMKIVSDLKSKVDRTRDSGYILAAYIQDSMDDIEELKEDVSDVERELDGVERELDYIESKVESIQNKNNSY